jgi:membrane dipeptidase
MTASAIPIFDGHNDVLLELYQRARGEGVTFFDRSDKGHLDLPRAREGGFGGGFFAVYVPPDPSLPQQPFDLPTTDAYEFPLPPPLDIGYAQRAAIAMAAGLFRIEAESRGQVKVVRAADELSACLRGGVLAAILHMEGAEAIDPELNALEVFYQAGLRSLGPVWSRANVFGHGVPFAYPRSPDTGPGLTAPGKELVRACNRLGILVDLSHMNERGFWDVAKLSEAPLVATHSNAHALCASTRNLTDRQLDAIRESDGMVGLNFAVCFLREDGWNEPDTPLDVMADHVDYLVERIGIDRVGFGSDFDGAKVSRDLGDVAGMPKLIAALRARGYDEPALRKLAHENWLRVLRKTWRG